MWTSHPTLLVPGSNDIHSRDYPHTDRHGDTRMNDLQLMSGVCSLLLMSVYVN